MTKTIVVFGATGGQGGSVITTYLNEIGWKVRGVTRNASSTRAEALKARGVEVFQADLDDSVSLADTIEGAQAIFGVTDYWGLVRDIAAQQGAMGTQAIDELAKEAEAQQLKNLIDMAAKSPVLERLIISSLPNVIKLSHGKYPNVFPYNGKAEAVDYIEENYPDLWSKTSVYRPGYFLVNFIDQPMGQPQKGEDGITRFVSNFNINLKIPIIAHDEDSGALVKALIDDAPGKSLTGYREWATMNEVAQVFENATGYKTEAIQLPIGEFGFDCPPVLQRDFIDNFAFANEFGLEGRDDPTLVHPKDLASPPKLDSLEAWIKKQDWKELLGSPRS